MQLVKQGIDIDSLYEREGKFHGHIFNLIKQSPAIFENAKRTWEYKSLAQDAIEAFCSSSTAGWGKQDGHLLLCNLETTFSEALSYRVSVINEGLRLFVKDGAQYRIATMADDDYKYVARLSEEGHAYDLQFRTTPPWAENLYLNSRALELYIWFYGEVTTDDRIRVARRWAIERILDNEGDASADKTTRPESPRKTENLLRAFVCIATYAYGYDPESSKSSAPQEISDALNKLGQSIDPKTIRGWLKEGAALLPPLSKKE